MDNDTFVIRQWGKYVKLYQEGFVWVKRVEVNIGYRPVSRFSWHNNNYWV